MMIRRYCHDDLDSISILEKRAFEVGPYSKRYLREVLEDEQSISITAQIGEAIAGYTVAMPVDTEKIDIESIAVDPGYSGRGVGHAMMKNIQSKARFMGYSTIVLEVREKNANAISFYKVIGFMETEFLENFYIEKYRGSRNAYRMEKQIN